MKGLPSTISIIVPVYNGEKTLARCLDSVLAQTYADWECILINDGSTDGSAALLETYAAKDPRLVVLSVANGGVSRAKNLGLDKATGTLLTFADADDFLETSALEVLHALMEKTDADVAVGHLRFEDTAGLLLPTSPPLPTEGPNPLLLSPTQAVQTLFTGQPFAGHLPGKLLKRDKLQDLRFREDIVIYEDMLFLLSYMQQVKRLAYTPDVMYHYVIRDSGAMSAAFTQRKATSITACEAMNRLTEQCFPSSLAAARRFGLQNALWLLEDYLAAPPSTQQKPWALSARKEACAFIRSEPIANNLPLVQKAFCIAIKAGWPVFNALYCGPYQWAKRMDKQ